MGCWDETCGITRQPIFSGDPCVMVVFDHTKRDFNGWIVFSHTSDWDYVKEIHKGTYNDYGWLEELPHDHDDPRLNMPIVFFHQEVWDQCIKMQREKISINDIEEELVHLKHSKMTQELGSIVASKIPLEDYALPDHFEEFLLISAFAHSTRRVLLSAYCFRGCQDWDSVDQRDLILTLSQKLNDKLRQETEESRKEEEHEL